MSSVALARAYQQSFAAHPYGTLAITNGTLNALGDIVAQLTEKWVSQSACKTSSGPYREHWGYDLPRTMRFFLFGFAMGPVIGRWNFFLERHFPLRFQSTTPNGIGKVDIRALSKRVAADQLIMAPIGLAIFIGSMGIMEGRDRPHIRRKYAQLFYPALIANWQVWPLAQLINFRFMPLPYRVPFQSSCGVFWTLYLSILNSAEAHRQKELDAMEKMHSTD
ncbi:uncharacterized protein LAESUDRAFT_678725 [Laetiporus sulphureus 93-53]|uniref:Uncharacterized protein n=1 Tax=Laetiporus sulphureus 93-53 TaxID=1314785 RepID=A0A165ECZ4_9APHY|nr:uncharacterized protein LAESUDRAFT_678725 [Laetiporus sulphureus 93-53]KZT06761.1 hypothetical protein LAESUDRAFT_678725 [Laetiporus sulphureus 93-53]